MATFAEYPASTMGANHFALYPHSDPWTHDQSCPPSSTYADSAYLSASTFDSYQSHYSYSAPDQYDFPSSESLDQARNHILQAPSPANSASYSFDYPLDSGASGQSTISSAMGSPLAQPQSNSHWVQQQSAQVFNGMVAESDSLFATSSLDFEPISVIDKGCVDPSLIQPFSPTQFTGTQFPEIQQHNLPYPAISSPRISVNSPRPQSAKPKDSPSPQMRPQSRQPYPQYQASRRPSISSVHSRHSQNSLPSDDSNKGLCPIATCGRHVKDLKAHMLTHQNERPEKCPIPTCEYHTKGFARKYDKNRHTLTHYKGTMVCGFCPGSGSAAEKSFNRADVFKRHLTSVHNVEQTPPNARKRSATSSNKKPFGSAREVSGMCSTCGNNFASAQDFYEHLDDCVLRVVQQADPGEAINAKLLTEVAQDEQMQQTLDKHLLPTKIDLNAPAFFDQDEEVDVDDDEDADEDDSNDGTYGSRRCKSAKGRKVDATRLASNGAVTKPVRNGLAYSKNGVSLSSPVTVKGSKRRKNYPLCWGAATEKMRMKKRVVCVYDGQRRLWKDDMMLDTDHEVRIPISTDGKAWVTDLDLQTLRRSESLHNATEEEKGSWFPDGDVESLMAS